MDLMELEDLSRYDLHLGCGGEASLRAFQPSGSR